MQVRIDSGVHRLLKLEAIRAGKTIKEYLEEVLANRWDEEGVIWE
jgi:predicted HicB family RNase H-like nuclease